MENEELVYLERATADGAGSVDVHLEREGMKIACGISVTSTEAQELNNIEKRQAAQGAAKEQWVTGRKVKVQFQPVEQEKEKSKLRMIGRVLLSSARRVKGRELQVVIRVALRRSR